MPFNKTSIKPCLCVSFRTSQTERLFSFDFGFIADHFELYSLFLFSEAPDQPPFH